jgi:hypothetical protein
LCSVVGCHESSMNDSNAPAADARRFIKTHK